MNRRFPKLSIHTINTALLRSATLLALLGSMIAAPCALAQGRDSGIQCGASPGLPLAFPPTVIVNKDVGDDRFAITFDLASSRAIGNVFSADGSVTALICIAEPDSWVTGDDPICFQCVGADGCTGDSCPSYDDAGSQCIPRSFFEAPCNPDAVGRNGLNYNDTWIGGFPSVSQEDCRDNGTQNQCNVWAYKNTEDSPANNVGYCAQLGCQQ